MTAPMVLDGPMNRVAFQAYIEQVLVPTLRRGDQARLIGFRSKSPDTTLGPAYCWRALC
jgi:hypothetical protein